MTPATKQVRFGLRSAPPLTDEILAGYRSRIDSLPDTSPVKAVLDQLWKCCKAWWDLPEAVGTPQVPHLSGFGLVVDLQEDHKRALWDLIPWDHELDALAGANDGKLGLFDAIDADANHRNGEKRRAWNLSVYSHVVSTFYPTDPTEYDMVWQAIHCEDKWLGMVSDAEKAEYSQRKQRAADCCDAIVKAVSGRDCAAVPNPTFEPKPLRDMAMHLVWHVRELNLDREPLTSDKL